MSFTVQKKENQSRKVKSLKASIKIYFFLEVVVHLDALQPHFETALIGVQSIVLAAIS